MRLRTTTTAMAMVLAGSIGGAMVASPASAAIGDCTNYPNTICLVDKDNWTGQVWRQYPEQIDGCRKLSREGFNNKASIIYNQVQFHVGLVVYDRDDCTGAKMEFGSNEGATLTGMWFDNKASSLRVVLY
jgi:hypothetical protein